jgi:hypothetical protein
MISNYMTHNSPIIKNVNLSGSPPSEILLYNFQQHTAMTYMDELYKSLNFTMCPSCFRTIDIASGRTWRPEHYDDFIQNEQCNCSLSL